MRFAILVRSVRRIKSTLHPDTLEKYRATPPISIAMLFQKYVLLLAENSIYTTNLYHDIRHPFASRCFCRSISLIIRVGGRQNTPKSDQDATEDGEQRGQEESVGQEQEEDMRRSLEERDAEGEESQIEALAMSMLSSKL